MSRTAIIALALLLVLCCLAALAGGLLYSLWPRPVAKPLVLINSPRHGAELAVGAVTTVEAVARDQDKITRVELWVDGHLVEAQTSSLTGGISPHPLVAQWRPERAGRHTLTVRAFNTAEVRAHASLDVEAIELPDRDEDGVSDEVDLCPDQPGSQAADGCSDRDGDGIRDTVDACPAEAGLLDAIGCPAPGDGDRDRGSRFSRDGGPQFGSAESGGGEQRSPGGRGCPRAGRGPGAGA